MSLPPTIADRVTRIVQETLVVDEAPAVAQLVTDLGLDSLNTVNLVMDVETEFDIEITTADAENIVTVGDLITLVERLAA